MELEYTIGFGKDSQSFTLPAENLLLDMKAKTPEKQDNEEAIITQALKQPIGTEQISDICSPGEKICIITSDITRPCPSHKILPPLLHELEEAGVYPEDITVVFALGSHRRHTEEEKKKLVGEEVYAKVHTIDSDPEDTVYLGTTQYGTPVNITSFVAQADRRICVGNIEFHYFAGYSGGGKAIMPGVSDRAAIQANHSRMVEDCARAGAIDDNTLRLDIEEAADICGCDFILNVILDEDKNIIAAVAGDHRQAHRKGCFILDQIYKIPLTSQADIVIATPGGFPKDLNLYQTQKALDNAQHAVKPGGIIILAGQCPEGYGEHVFEEWLLSANKSEDLIERVGREFQLGGHKAVAIAMVLKKAQVFFVSEMPTAEASRTFMKPYDNVQQALDDALQQLGHDSKIIIMSHAGSTLPIFA